MADAPIKRIPLLRLCLGTTATPANTYPFSRVTVTVVMRWHKCTNSSVTELTAW